MLIVVQHAGFAGAALALMTWSWQLVHGKDKPLHIPLRSFSFAQAKLLSINLPQHLKDRNLVRDTRGSRTSEFTNE